MRIERNCYESFDRCDGTVRLRTVFFGTPEWAVPSLRALLDAGIDVGAVVTNPDRPAGRGMHVRASPVKDVAFEAGLPVLQPQRARDEEFIESLRAHAPEVAVVVAYGRILPPEVLEVPTLGFVNVHFSLLPHYRGAAPVQRAIIDGNSETGVTIILLTEGMDEGPVLAERRVPIDQEDTAGTLGKRLADIGAQLLVETLPPYTEGRISPRDQDHERATYAPKITDEDARIEWGKPATEIRNLIRGLNPDPGAWTTLEGKRIKIFGARPASFEGNLDPGQVATTKEGLLVGTMDQPLLLMDVQVEGKRRMAGADAARGLRLDDRARAV
jgi:methionyl-tRNA formyltransferase